MDRMSFLNDIAAQQDFERQQMQQMPSINPQNTIPIIVKDVSLKSNNPNDKIRSSGNCVVSDNANLSKAGSSEINKTAQESQSTMAVSNANGSTGENRQIELQKLVQQIFVAQAQVQLEASEIERAQSVAVNAQQSLEESANNVRVLTSALHAAQEKVATAALRAQTTQLQLAAHDQLLFTARQKVDALSAQMVGLQAQEGIGESKAAIDLASLLSKLKQPLPDNQKPTAIPSILGQNSLVDNEDSPTDEDTSIKRGISIHKDTISSTKQIKTDSNISPEDLQDLVHFILATGPRNGHETSNHVSDDSSLRNVKTTVDDNLKKASDQKYLNEFLSNIRNPQLKDKSNKSNSKSGAPSMTQKLSDRILNLYESMLSPKVKKSDQSIADILIPEKDMEDAELSEKQNQAAFYYEIDPQEERYIERD